ncbi:MAG: helix-turn-helix domain-containing protein [Pseudomonadales bacterium]|nr:helix-turn-helix domain-containing protein [Pseudomonadales bacterium]
MIPAPLPAVEICESARLSRDSRFDGRFIVAVVTKGIYCRPICPARPPARANVRYFLTAAEALDAGYRACLRCKPERASILPEWTLASDTVIRAMRLIGDGFINDQPVSLLASELGVSSRQLNRLFKEELGTTPKNVLRNQRLALAMRLIGDTSMKLLDIAYAAGYTSYRRFNDEIGKVYHCSPRELKQRVCRNNIGASMLVTSPATSPTATSRDIVLCLPVRQPYDPAWIFGFLGKRAIPPYESVQGLCYKRSLGPGIHVQVDWQADGIRVQIPRACARNTGDLLCNVRRLFDLDADSRIIDDNLNAHSVLKPYLAAGGGLRVPGAWSGFEVGVRAIMGQQVSVQRATRLVSAFVDYYSADGQFPLPGVVAGENPSHLGMPRSRGLAIQILAQRVTSNELQLSDTCSFGSLREQLLAIPGIGPWTAEYIAMRCGRDPDAFPENDWVVRKHLSMSAKQTRLLAETWRPWRAYALMYLWRGK